MHFQLPFHATWHYSWYSLGKRSLTWNLLAFVEFFFSLAFRHTYPCCFIALAPHNWLLVMDAGGKQGRDKGNVLTCYKEGGTCQAGLPFWASPPSLSSEPRQLLPVLNDLTHWKTLLPVAYTLRASLPILETICTEFCTHMSHLSQVSKRLTRNAGCSALALKDTRTSLAQGSTLAIISQLVTCHIVCVTIWSADVLDCFSSVV